MSALQIPPAPTAPRSTPSSAPDGTRPALRLVEAPARPSLAPTGPLQAWRRRIGALLLLVAAMVLLVEAVSGPVGAVAPVGEMAPASAATVVVEPGQTLWDVAAEHAPVDVGAAAYVRELAELNSISNGAVDAWQVLRLPS